LAKILDIKLMPTVAAMIKSADSADELADSLTNKYGGQIAKEGKDLIREPLAKHPRGLGATGRSYSAVKYRKGRKKGAGRREYIIYEAVGGANEKIRKGIPAGIKANEGGLRVWATAKRIPLKHPREFVSQKGTSKSMREYQESDRAGAPVRYISPKQKRRIRPYKSDEDKFTAAIRAISGALFREGTQRPARPPLQGANWMKYYPEGQGRFDYVAFAVRTKQPQIRGIISRASDDITKALVHHVLSGRGRMGFSTGISIGRYVR